MKMAARLGIFGISLEMVMHVGLAQVGLFGVKSEFELW